jgi:hypothetical protein
VSAIDAGESVWSARTRQWTPSDLVDSEGLYASVWRRGANAGRGAANASHNVSPHARTAQAPYELGCPWAVSSTESRPTERIRACWRGVCTRIADRRNVPWEWMAINIRGPASTNRFLAGRLRRLALTTAFLVSPVTRTLRRDAQSSPAHSAHPGHRWAVPHRHAISARFLRCWCRLRRRSRGSHLLIAVVSFFPMKELARENFRAFLGEHPTAAHVRIPRSTPPTSADSK